MVWTHALAAGRLLAESCAAHALNAFVNGFILVVVANVPEVSGHRQMSSHYAMC